jgi:hypothetical protein
VMVGREQPGAKMPSAKAMRALTNCYPEGRNKDELRQSGGTRTWRIPRHMFRRTGE